MKYLSSGCHMLTAFCPQPQKPAETHLTASRMWASLVQKCVQTQPMKVLTEGQLRLYRILEGG